MICYFYGFVLFSGRVPGQTGILVDIVGIVV